MPNPLVRRRLSGSRLDPVPPVQYRTFDGVNDSLQSAATIDLTAVNKISIVFWMWWDSFANDDKTALEFSASLANPGTFNFKPNDAAGGLSVGVNGNVGFSSSQYTRPTAAAWHHYGLLLDFSLGPFLETSLYLDGALQTAITNADTSDNSANFSNSTLNVMSRNNASRFGAGRQARLGLWPAILTPGELASLYRGTPVAQIRPDVAPYYWPLDGVSSPEPYALTRAVNLTVFT